MPNFRSLKIEIPPYAFGYHTPPKRTSDSNLSNTQNNLEDGPPTSTTLFFHLGRTPRLDRDHGSSKKSKTRKTSSESPVFVSPLDSASTPDSKEQYSTPLGLQESHDAEAASSPSVAIFSVCGSPGVFKHLPLREYSRSHSKEPSPKAESRGSPAGSPISFTHPLYPRSPKTTHSPSPSKPTSPISAHRSSYLTFSKISKYASSLRRHKRPSVSPNSIRNSRISPTATSPTRRTTSPGEKESPRKPSPALSSRMRSPSPVDHHGLDNAPTTPPHLRNPLPSKPPAPAYPTARAALVEITLYNLYILKHSLFAILYQVCIARPDSHLYSSQSSAIPLVESVLTLLSQLASRVEGLRPYPNSYYRTPSTELSNFLKYITTGPSTFVTALPPSAGHPSSIQAVVTEAMKAIREDNWAFSKQHIFDCARLKRGRRILADDRTDAVMKVLKDLGKEIDRFERALRDLVRPLKAGFGGSGAETSVVEDTAAGSDSSSSTESADDSSQQLDELSQKLDLLAEYFDDREKKVERRIRAIEKLSKRVVRLERTASSGKDSWVGTRTRAFLGRF